MNDASLGYVALVKREIERLEFEITELKGQLDQSRAEVKDWKRRYETALSVQTKKEKV